jgi:DNA-binding beta-propeller fold protein YncE
VRTTIVRLAGCCSAALALAVGAAPALADPSDPLLVFTPTPANPQDADGYLEGPCGIAVASDGDFYVSDYYHDAVRVFSPEAGARPFPLTGVDPLDGPCGLALDASDNLYVNDFHRNVTKFTPYPDFVRGPVLDEDHPTGVAVDSAGGEVYVDARTHIAVYDSSGAPVLDGGVPLRIGLGSLGDGYGLAVSRFPGTAGRLYVADAATDTVKVYDPALDKDDPVAEIVGPGVGGFVSLRDSALAVDRVSGNLYVADNLQPQHTEEPEAAIYVFGPTGAYRGRLKHNIVDALPPGLAVDNSPFSTQGRVYVTSGNTLGASVYIYPPGAQTDVVGPPVGPFGEKKGFAAASAVQSSAPLPDSADGSQPGRVAATTSKIVQNGSLRLRANGRLSPRRLPRRASAPIAVTVGWKLATTDDSIVPQLKRLQIEINRNGRFEYAGLPTCPYERIETASSSRALAACRSALVGQGRFTAEITLEGQQPYATGGRLLVFNGKSRGRPVLFGQIYSPRPFATSFVIAFEVKRLSRGAYGTMLSAALPKALSAWGNLTGIEMRLARRYGYRGSRRSYLSANCPAPRGFTKAVFPLARASFDFAGGAKLDSVLTETCEAKG